MFKSSEGKNTFHIHIQPIDWLGRNCGVKLCFVLTTAPATATAMTNKATGAKGYKCTVSLCQPFIGWSGFVDKEIAKFCFCLYIHMCVWICLCFFCFVYLLSLLFVLPLFVYFLTHILLRVFGVDFVFVFLSDKGPLSQSFKCVNLCKKLLVAVSFSPVKSCLMIFQFVYILSITF